MQEDDVTYRDAMNTPDKFRTTVHGTVFGQRTSHVDGLTAGDQLVLIPDPPDNDPPSVWVHLPGGDPVGHLPPEINLWLVPWMIHGGKATARAIRVSGSETPSWKRLVIEVRCDAVRKTGTRQQEG